MSSSHPRVTIRVARRRPRYRELVDFTGGPVEDVPSVRAEGLAYVEVGAGLSARELPRLAAVAEQLRPAREVVILGTNRTACEEARRALLKLWEKPVPVPPTTGLGPWVDLLAGHVPPSPAA